jgi:uncharacterized membrane protein
MIARSYWKGFATGVGAFAGGAVTVTLLAKFFGHYAYVQRFEKTLQIGRPVEVVFNAWTNPETLLEASSIVKELSVSGDHSHWKIEVDGKQVEWDAKIEQLIPNQAIGWKSIHGPKHTGRIAFSPLGNNTIVHMTMNYAPPFLLRLPFMQPVSGHIQRCIEQVLRDFKAALEGKGQEQAIRIASIHAEDLSRATGTFGGNKF